jgi:photosystem II stability/assembly factor-like uncharacterized protein
MNSRIALLGLVFWSFGVPRGLAGQAWRQIGPPGESVWFAAIDPMSPLTLYAATQSSDPGSPLLMKTTDRGLHWSRADSGLPLNQVVWKVVVQPGNSTNVYALVGTSLFLSEDGGGSWRAVNLGVSVSAHVRDFAFDPERGSVLFAATEQGIWRSDDAGINSFSANSSLDVWKIVVTAHMLYASDGTGVFRSTDGRTWIAANGVIPGVPAIEVRAVDPLAPSTAYVAAIFGFCGPRCPQASVLYKTTDAGASWVAAGVPASSSRIDVALDPARPFVIYAAAGCHVLRSPDGGSTWEDVSSNTLPYCVNAVTFDPSNSTALAWGPSLYERSFPSGSLCLPGSLDLCLHGGRFQVQVRWHVPTSSTPEDGHSILRTDDAGYFWVFTPNNVELAVKVVDGRLVNGKFWVFVAALTDVEYDLTVSDTQTGSVWRHHNLSGRLESLADTNAF